MPQDIQVFCAKCLRPMSPADSKMRPELFLHDACLPPELVQALPPDTITLTRDQVRGIVEKAIARYSVFRLSRDLDAAVEQAVNAVVEVAFAGLTKE